VAAFSHQACLLYPFSSPPLSKFLFLGLDLLPDCYDAYQSNSAKVHFVSPQECRELFLWEETRSVDNSGCFKLNGIEFEAGVEFAHKRVDVRYDPFDLSVVEIWRDGLRIKQAQPLVIGEFIRHSQIPQWTNTRKPTGSRLLAVYEKQNSQRDQRRNAAISFKKSKDDDSHV
jgi:hypothetical protein